MRGCWRIGGWVESLTRPGPGGLLWVVRSSARGGQRKGTIAGGQRRLNGRKIAGHGSVMSAETREIGFLGRYGTMKSMGEAERYNMDEGSKEG